MLYLCLSIVCFYLGVISLFFKRRAFFLYMILLAVIPTGNMFNKTISFNGLYFYDYFLFGAVLSIIFRGMLESKIRVKTDKISLVALTIFVIYFVYAFMTKGLSDKILLKDFRPVMILVSCLIFKHYIIDDKIITKKLWRIIVLLAAVSNIFIIIALRLNLIVSQDVYYQVNSFRYLDASTFVSAVFIIHHMCVSCPYRTQKEKYAHRLLLLFSVVNILISNSRFIVLSICFAIVLSQIGNFKKFAEKCFYAAVIIGSLLAISTIFEIERVMSALSVASVFGQFVIRFSPAMTAIQEMNGLDFLFGLGAGTGFEIPWFEYRDQISSLNSSIDSAYLTFYVKYGVVSAFFLFSYLHIIPRFRSKKMFASSGIFLAMMFIVSAIPYQPYAIAYFSSVLIAINIPGASSITSKV